MNKFYDGVEQLKNKLLEMGSLVEAGIERSVIAITQGDLSAAREVLKNEERINAMEIQIDALATDLLALHQPLSSNLRFLIAVLNVNSNLERMGDISFKIAHTANSLGRCEFVKQAVDIPIMAKLVQSMVRKSLDAFVQRNCSLAREVLTSDDAVDDLHSACYQQLMLLMQEDHDSIRASVDLVTVSSGLERLADHSTNIAEEVLFYVEGIDVRHHAERTSKK